jgi:ubiquitin-like modifier-activating enzyme ATG7
MEETVRKEFEGLKELVEAHDALFLLLDTRESRWLPTVMGKAAGKIVLNAALGFDSFVVMRHGLKPSEEGPEKSGAVELGCYFCNDVVAPADSLKDATLDQQCTVTRPGVATLASAMLVELFVSILQHPLRARAPATSDESSPLARTSGGQEEEELQHPLGAVPHTIRGFLSNFSNMLITGKPYDCCSACSDKVIKKYKQEGWEFVKRVLNERGYVEEVSGLAEVQRQAEKLGEDVDWDDEEGGNDDGEGELI